MKELFEHNTYIFETDDEMITSIIRDEEGNELGRTVREDKSRRNKSWDLFDSKEKKWGTVTKTIRGIIISTLTWVFTDHNETTIAKTKKKWFVTETFWVKDPEDNKLYKISKISDKSLSRGVKYIVKDINGTIVAEITKEDTGDSSYKYILEIKKNMPPLIALLIVPTLDDFKRDFDKLEKSRSDSILDIFDLFPP